MIVVDCSIFCHPELNNRQFTNFTLALLEVAFNMQCQYNAINKGCFIYSKVQMVLIIQRYFGVNLFTCSTALD